tara:strand:+ start:82 stop:660 length:579 start_codon:yes stop_codon:yes gene_type:complete
MSNRPILFFSPNSEHCIDVWKLLKQNSILNTLIKINVDDPENKIPNQINVLPSIFVRGEPIITGKDNIISYFKLNRNIVDNSVSNNSNNTNNTNNTNKNENSKSLPPLGDKEVPFKNQNDSMFLNTNEMGSNWSDNYSFINNNGVQAHSFEMLEQTDEGKKVDRGSNKKTLMDKRMEQMMNERNQISAINRV